MTLAGVALAAVAVLLAAGVALRGIAGPVPNGHFASITAIGMAADNMWRWHTVLPIIGYSDHLSGAPAYYMHHPLGLFWDMALLGKVFGFSDWVLRLPPLFYMALTPLFIYRLGREVWGPLEGRAGGAGVRGAADHPRLRELSRPRAALHLRLRGRRLGLRPLHPQLA